MAGRVYGTRIGQLLRVTDRLLGTVGVSLGDESLMFNIAFFLCFSLVDVCDVLGFLLLVVRSLYTASVEGIGIFGNKWRMT